MAKSAAIVGGGLGGLATAGYLVQNGWSVDVFERSAQLPQTGTALGMWPEALAALDAIGVANRIRELGAVQRRADIRRSDGSTLARVASRGDSAIVSRPTLLNSLADALPGGVVKFSAPVESVDELQGYDVIVGADGVNSGIRDEVLSRRVQARHLGFSALIGWAGGVTDVAAETWGEGKIFGITPRDGELTNWFAAYREPADVPMPSDPTTFLRNQFGHWHMDVQRLLDRIDESSFIHYHVKEMPKLPTFTRGNAVIIGDAAHAMAPNLGRGACESLVDAVTLGAALVERGVEDGLKQYDRSRRKPVQRLVATSRLVSRLALSTKLTGPRDVAIRLASRFA